MNGERLRQVRKLRRLTQTQVAADAGATSATISQIESGVLQPSGELAERIAAAIAFPPEFLDRGSGPELPIGSLAFRARRAATKRELYEAQAWAEIALECMNGLAEGFELPEIRVPSVEDETPEAAAQIARGAMGVSADRPVPNVTLAMEQASVTVLAVPVPLGHRDAFSTWTIEPRPRPLVVVCTKDIPGDRLRRSLAHELGHIVLHRGPRGAIADLEREADRFASEFLTPADGILHELVRPVSIRSLSEIKPRWGVSVGSLVFRARDLGVISDRRARSLHIQISKMWGRTNPEPIKIPIEKPRALRKLAESVYGDPPDPRRLAFDFALPLQVAAAILGAHASRSEVVAAVPNEVRDDKIVRFSRRRLSRADSGGAEQA